MKLFTVAFPEFAIQRTSSLMKALSDKRVVDLRSLVEQAVQGKVTFDQEFAKKVLSEVLKSERSIRKWRTIIGYITLPIGFVPWIGTPAQKVIEEAIGRPLDIKFTKKHRWFYLLSDIAEA